MNHSDNSLFPEDELRRHLQWVPDQTPDPAFEAMVFARIQRRQQKAALTLAGSAISVIVLLAVCLLWMAASSLPYDFFPNILSGIARETPHFADTALVWIGYAPFLAVAYWEQLRPLLLLTLTVAFAAILILEISAILILNHRKAQS